MNPDPIFEPTFLNLEYVFFKLTKFFQKLYPFFRELFSGGKLGAFLVFFFSTLLVFLVAWITYSMIRIKELEREKSIRMNHVLFSRKSENTAKRNPRWIQVQEHINANNPAEWRLAIIEADTILEDMVMKMGIPGENLGERLKNTEPSDFLTLQLAWAAHKVRNKIAHEGSAYNLTYKDARQAIANYEEVFKEFDFI